MNKVNKVSCIYLHWVVSGNSYGEDGRPLIDKLKVGLADNLEKRKLSYYSDGWKDPDCGMIHVLPIDTDKYSLPILEFLTQLIMRQDYLRIDPSVLDLETFPWSQQAIDTFKSLTPEKIYRLSAGKALRVLDKVKGPMKNKAREEIVKFLSKDLLGIMETKPEWTEDELYELDPLQELEPSQAYRYILLPGMGEYWEKENGFIRAKKKGGN